MKTSKKTERKSWKNRKGAMAMITALVLVAILGLVACALDIGYIEMARTQLQAAADASSLAGGTELLPGLGLFKTKTPDEVADAAAPVAAEYAGYNRNAERGGTHVDEDRDVVFGKATFDASGCNCWQKTPASEGAEYYNYVEVTPLRNQPGGDGDGPAPLFFARIFGIGDKSMRATSTTAILPSNGFRVVEEDDRANVMPFAFNALLWDRFLRAQKYLDDHPGTNLNNWNTLQQIKDTPDYPTEPLFGAKTTTNGTGNPVQLFFDAYTRNNDTGAVSNGADGWLEVNIYPKQVNVGGSASGNHGTIDFGSGNNSTNDLRRKIREGLNENDLSNYENNEIVLREDDPLDDGGNPGMSSGMSDALNDVIGQCKAIALYSSLSGNGNNSTYTLVRFVSGSVMHVVLNGNQNNRHVFYQPCVLVDNNAVPDTDEEIGPDTTIFTPLTLIR
jgi:Flp pilus assembly protein TadG